MRASERTTPGVGKQQQWRKRERAGESVSNGAQRERSRKRRRRRRRGSHPPPPSSATPLLPPCAQPDKVALIKICHFPFQKKKLPAMPSAPLCEVSVTGKEKGKFPYLMGKLYITKKPVWTEDEKKERRRVRSVSSVISALASDGVRSPGFISVWLRHHCYHFSAVR